MQRTLKINKTYGKNKAENNLQLSTKAKTPFKKRFSMFL